MMRKLLATPLLTEKGPNFFCGRKHKKAIFRIGFFSRESFGKKIDEFLLILGH
ncbi:hypothetical protein MFUM_1040010 [Methylacidiphilum fumariolicum SolV]|uniref:Uncharacterized protein n=2 Tax=Candidatus Methylacidiphilum fumarolicum TaxID=591154 RepID=I0JW25_METFB|nr:conserved protein of unknown function [Candidatus Methylacidiphilum fumarolicum]CCG91444.1 hypothetical protein MFUM_1040010 [Methylacidiphilum fumariolicum SolV]